MEPLLAFEHPGESTSTAAWLSRPQDRPIEPESQEPKEFERYLGQLRVHQAHYRRGVAEAGRPLSGSAAEIAAVHARLAQQFLDAQRGLIIRAVEATQQIAAIEDNPDSIPEVEVFGIDLAGFEARMRTRLDQWWTEEAAAVQNAVDAALARDVIRRHLQRIKGSDVAQVAGRDQLVGVIGDGDADALPAQVLDLMDAADLGDLDRLFEALIDMLEDPAPSQTAPSGSPAFNAGSTTEFALAAASQPAAPTAPQASAISSDEQFARFWGSGPGPVGRVGRPWRFVQMLLPTSVMVATLGLVLALVG